MTDPYDHPLWDDIEGAITGAYHAAPNGEGVLGALDSAARAAVLVIGGMKAPEAIVTAIGDYGDDGVPRKYGVIPRPLTIQPMAGSMLVLMFESDEERNQAIKGVETNGKR